VSDARILNEDTPEGRLAAVAVLVATKFEDRYNQTGQGPRRPDVADLREVLRPYVQEIELRARLDEFEKIHGGKAARRSELVRMLYVCQLQMPVAHRL
jgi:hypothetical protein